MKEYTLIGIDGNAYVIMGYVQRIMRQEGFSWEEIDAYHERATSGDYSDLLNTPTIPPATSVVQSSAPPLSLFPQKESDQATYVRSQHRAE